MKSPIPYYGSKASLAHRIVGLMPKHTHYVEPFAGSLAVLLAKGPSAMETVNDLDGDLMAFWRVLRERPNELARAAAMTPHSRAEYDSSRNLEASPTELERARRVWVLLSQGRGATLRETGWRFYRKPGSSSYSMPDYLDAYVARIAPAAARLRHVSLECRPGLEVIREYGQHPDVLLYCDPPYLASSRNTANFRREMGSKRSHQELISTLRGCAAAVLLSGYPSELYDLLLSDWDRVELSAWTGNGIGNGKTVTVGRRVEMLWSNRSISEPDLFSAMADVNAHGQDDAIG